jgi:hypothetical protein
MKVILDSSDVYALIGQETPEFPKYATQILNLANQNAQGTRAKIVGQMSELIQEFPGGSLPQWRQWYLERHPGAIEAATDKIWDMLAGLKESADTITRGMVQAWVEDLVIVKTYMGLHYQQIILAYLAKRSSQTVRLAVPEEESKGIDGFLGNEPVSIKPASYRTTFAATTERLPARVVYYEKTQAGLTLEFDPWWTESQDAHLPR